MSIFDQVLNKKQENHPQDEIAPPVAAADLQKRQDLSVLSHLDSRSTEAVTHAQQEAVRIHSAQIESIQILFGLLYDEEIFKLLSDFGVDVAKLSSEIQAKEQVGNFTDQPTFSDESKNVFTSSYESAKKRGADFITPEDILNSLFSGSLSAQSILMSKGLKKENIEQSMSKKGGTNKKRVLDTYGSDLTAFAKEGKLDPIAGREREIDRTIHILLRRTKNNPIIIGQAGVGKTAIVEGLAQAIVTGNVPKELSQKKIYQIDLSSLVAGASHRGEFEERLKGVINESMAADGQIILFIDEIHTLIGTGDESGSLDASNIIKPFLARGQLQIIGTTTTSEYRKNFEKDKAFERRFQPVLVEEPSEEAAVEMLKVIRPKYEKYHNVVIPDDVLVEAVKLSKKYIGDRYLPDKGVDLMDEASADVKLKASKGGANQVTKEDIQNVVSNWTGIPITKLTEDESKKLLELEDRIHQRLIDQEEAVRLVSEAVRRGRIGLSSPTRPISSFVFLGPTGVGKTELAKTMAEILFGRDDAMIRLDMSEYMEKHEVAKLIGSPPGYVGYDEGGQLTEAVRTKPYSIVLFDEIEKAHPDVFNILLQVLEDGRLTDNKGNTVSFKNTIIVCTSNIGSVLIQQDLSESASGEEFEKKYQELKKVVQGELVKFFRPELLNRFDETVIFKPLRREDMEKIAKLGIDKTCGLLKEQGYGMEISLPALTVLANMGYDPVYGARPLRRLIQSLVENPVAMLIINKTFIPGDSIMVDYVGDEFKFTKIEKPVGTNPSSSVTSPLEDKTASLNPPPPPGPVNEIPIQKDHLSAVS